MRDSKAIIFKKKMGEKMLSRHCLDIKFWRKIFENSKKPIFPRFIKNEAENKKSVLLEA